MINAENISEIMFNADPAKTACVENEAYDEYDRIADDVYDRIMNDHEAVRYAVSNAFVASFGPLDELDADAIEVVVSGIEDLVDD